MITMPKRKPRLTPRERQRIARQLEENIRAAYYMRLPRNFLNDLSEFGGECGGSYSAVGERVRNLAAFADYSRKGD